MIEDLTALQVAGASMLDEATAAAEAMTLARRATGRGRIFLADADCLPQTLAVLATRAEPLGIDLVVARLTPEVVAAQPAGELFGVLLAYPGASGEIADPRPVIAAASARGAAVAVAADLLALTLLTPPGELGADIAIGTTQRFGVPMGFGGPHAAYIAVRDNLRRQLPGRLVGVSVDADGQPAYRLALQAREQHIRREKATSNICTAQVLLAVIAGMYAAYHGADGLAAIARRVHGKAVALAATLRTLGAAVEPAAFFDTVRVRGLPGGRGGACPAGRLQRLPGGHGHGAGCLRRDDNRRSCAGGRGRAGRAPGRGGEPGRWWWDAPGGPAAHLALPHPPGLPRAPQRDGHAPLPASAGRLRHRARPVDDPAGLVHDEAERCGGDGGHHVAGVRRHPPVRPSRADGRLRRADRPAGGVAGGDHRLPRGVAAAERRVAGGTGRPARDPPLPHRPRRRRARHMPDPGVRTRHERGQRRAGRAAGEGGQVRRRRRHRPRRPAGEAGRARGARGCDHADLPVHQRRVRAHRDRRLRPRARRR